LLAVYRDQAWLWSIGGKVEAKLWMRNHRTLVAAIAPDGATVVIAFWNDRADISKIRIWSIELNRWLPAGAENSGTVRSVGLLKDAGERIIAGSAKGWITTWSLDGRRERTWLISQTGLVEFVVSASSQEIVALSLDQRISAWDLASGAKRWEVQANGAWGIGYLPEESGLYAYGRGVGSVSWPILRNDFLPIAARPLLNVPIDLRPIPTLKDPAKPLLSHLQSSPTSVVPSVTVLGTLFDLGAKLLPIIVLITIAVAVAGFFRANRQTLILTIIALASFYNILVFFSRYDVSEASSFLTIVNAQAIGVAMLRGLVLAVAAHVFAPTETQRPWR
jgi:hypothetical protein